jgi:peptide-methionine (S)-S-oxide reductase
MINIINKNVLQRATLADGWLWCIGGDFSQVKGIHSAISGYMDEHSDNIHGDIYTGNSGQAEVVQLNLIISI